MEVVNYIAMDGRLTDVKFVYSKLVRQYESHGHTYIEMREFLKRANPNQKMGLEKIMRREVKQ